MTILCSLKWCGTQGGSGGISTPYQRNGTFSEVEFLTDTLASEILKMSIEH